MDINNNINEIVSDLKKDEKMKNDDKMNKEPNIIKKKKSINKENNKNNINEDIKEFIVSDLNIESEINNNYKVEEDSNLEMWNEIQREEIWILTIFKKKLKNWKTIY